MRCKCERDTARRAGRSVAPGVATAVGTPLSTCKHKHTNTNTQNPATRSAAEAALLAFRASPDALAASRAALDTPSASPGAQFQAALALRDAGLRHWDALGREGQGQLMQYLEEWLLSRSAGATPPPPRVVASQVAATLAACLKRAWGSMDDTTRSACLGRLEVEAVGPPSLRAATALTTLSAIVSEFAPATASPLGQPWEYHDACRASLQAGWLPRLWSVAASAARAAAATTPPAPSLAPALTLAADVLAWDWAPVGAAASSYGGGRPPADGSVAVRPGAALRDALVSPSALDWLHTAVLPALASTGPASDASIAARQTIVLLAGLDGDIFPLDAPGARSAHARAVLASALPWAHPPPAALAAADAGTDGGALVDGCRALAALAATVRAGGLDGAGATPGAPSGALAALADLTVACLAASGGDDAGGAADEAVDVLLDGWAAALAPGCTAVGVAPLPPAATDAAARVFSALLQAGLAAAAADADGDEDEGEAAAAADGGTGADDPLARAAVVARAAPAAALHLLAAALDGARGAAATAAAAGDDPSAPLEQLVYAVRMAGAVLADGGAGETPAPPVELAAAPDAVSPLIARLLDVTAAGAAGPTAASPRVMEAAVCAVARVTAAYVCRDDDAPAPAGTTAAARAPLPPVLAAAYGPAGGGPSIVSSLARLSTSLLTQWPGEVDLHAAVAKQLLPSLVRARAAATASLASPDWAALADAFAAPDDRLACMAEPVHRALGAALARGAAGAPDAGAARSYVARLAAGPTSRLAALATRPTLKADAARGDVAAAVARAAEATRGLLRGAPPRAAPALASAFGAAAPHLTVLAGAFRSERRVSCLLLKLAADAVEALVVHLPPSDAAALVAWALDAARAHSRARAGAVAASPATHLRDDEVADAERELRALIRLTAALAARGVADFSAPAPAPDAVDVCGSLFAAFEAILPLATPPMLAHPKLAAAFHSLLGDVVESYPERVPMLPPPLGVALLSALDAGAASPDEACACPCLAGLAALARWAAADAAAGGSNGGPALGSQLAQRCIRPLLGRLLLADAPRAVADGAADALLPLALAAPDAWQGAVRELLAGCPEGGRDRVADALTGLNAAAALVAGGGGAAAERAARRKFRTAMARFVADARGVVRTR